MSGGTSVVLDGGELRLRPTAHPAERRNSHGAVFDLLATPEAAHRGSEATGTSKQSRARFLMPLRGGSGFSGAARKQKKTKGRGGPLRVGIAAFTCPTHGPIPPPTHRRPLPGPLWVGWPLQGPWVTPRGPQRPQRGDGRPSPQQQHPSQTTAGRPPEHTMATPNANQAPQGAGTSPRSPLVAIGGLWGCHLERKQPHVTF